MRPGDQLAGYRIESVLGRGGMGVVYAATQLSLNRTVALKVLPVDLRDDPVFRARFRREGEIQAAIDHPNIVTVYEAGETDEGLYLAMRRVRGTTLKHLIVAREVDGERAVRLLRPIADALDAAHAAGLTHRDVKPQNILVGDGDHAYLADFGLTRSATEPGLTKTGQFVGTVDYVAPEQIRGEQASAASDIYALAAVLYESLCGEVPYPRPSEHAVLFSHLSEPPPRVTEQRPELPPALDQVIARGMAKEPDERPSSATELVGDAARAITTGELPAATRIAAPATTVRAAAARRPSRGRIAVAVALVVAMALGAALALVLGTNGGSGSGDSDGGSGEARGDQITMRTVRGGKVVSNAQLVSYGEPPPTLQLQLTPLGPPYQLLLFDDLDAVRSFEALPESATQILGDGPGGALSTGSETDEPGTTGSFGAAMPANFRRYRYFGVVRVRQPTRELEVYDRVDRLSDP
jgi:hypothetical protein